MSNYWMIGGFKREMKYYPGINIPAKNVRMIQTATIHSRVYLVVSNSLDFLGKTHFALEKWRFLVFNLDDNLLFRGSTNNS